MTLKLSKIIPSRRETIQFDWVKKDFMNYGKFKEARSRMGLYYWKRCHWCGKDFEEKDIMALGHISGQGNKVFCQSCVKEAPCEKQS